MFDISRAEHLLDDLLEEHEHLVDQAAGFGLRTAAIPKGLMSVREAQKVIADMGANLEKIQKFYFSLGSAGFVPEEMKKDYDALLDKARKATTKCEEDVKKAREALVKHEDLLVGEAFQEAFQAVRMAIIDFDPADDVDLDFVTNLHLDADPSYAVGSIIVKKGPTKLYVVHVGYRAADDFFYGNIEAPAKYKKFEHVVKKNGLTKLPAFVRELAEQLKALSESHGTNVFRSRKKVELTLVDPEAIRTQIRPALEAALLKQWGQNASSVTWAAHPTVDGSGTSGSAAVRWEGWGWRDAMKSLGVARGRFTYYDKKRTELNTTLTLTLQNGQVWEVECKAPKWTYQFKAVGSKGYMENIRVSSIAELEAAWPVEYADSPPIAALRERATQLKVPFDPRSRSKTDIAVAILTAQTQRGLGPPNGFTIADGNVEIKLRRKDVKKSAASRLVDAWRARRTAGATGFGVLIEIPDVQKAFNKAIDESRHYKGHNTYAGTIGTKGNYLVRRREPFVVPPLKPGSWRTWPKEMQDFMENDRYADDKWGPACAVPVSEEKVLAKDTVTVTVEAKDEVEARRKGMLLIKATGRIPPKATIVVEVPEGTSGMTLVSKGARVSTWTVTGLRKQAIVGEITGWYFYGMAPE